MSKLHLQPLSASFTCGWFLCQPLLGIIVLSNTAFHMFACFACRGKAFDRKNKPGPNEHVAITRQLECAALRAAGWHAGVCREPAVVPAVPAAIAACSHHAALPRAPTQWPHGSGGRNCRGQWPADQRPSCTSPDSCDAGQDCPPSRTWHSIHSWTIHPYRPLCIEYVLSAVALCLLLR